MPAVTQHEPTRAEVEAWRARTAAGESITAVARDAGMSRAAVRRRLSGAVQPKVTAADVARWLYAYTIRRRSLRWIADTEGHDYETVRRRLLRAGATLRPVGGRRARTPRAQRRCEAVKGSEVVEWRRLYLEAGWSLREIALLADRNPATVRSRLLDVLRPRARPGADLARLRRMVEARAEAPYGAGPELAARFGYTPASWSVRLTQARKVLAKQRIAA